MKEAWQIHNDCILPALKLLDLMETMADRLMEHGLEG